MKKNITFTVEKKDPKDPKDTKDQKDSKSLKVPFDINSNKINIITQYIESDIKILNVIQKKSITENLKNKSVDRMIIIGKEVNNKFKDILTEDDLEKIIFIERDDQISFKIILDIADNIFKNKIICIIRSDIILPNHVELDDIETEFMLYPRDIISLSRIERLINGNLVRTEKMNKNLNSVELDAWIFKTPINIEVMKDALNDIIFYDKYSDILFNNVLHKNNYTMINNSKKYKIIRLLYDNNIDDRHLLNNREFPKKNIYLVPDNENLERIGIDNLLRSLNIDDRELYLIKCDIFNKYYKNK